MPIDVKICGLSTPDSVAAAVAGGATHVGFIFFPKSPRNVTPQSAGSLARLAGPNVRTVAVTVDSTDADLDAIVSTMRPDILQLHGSETPARVAEVKTRYGLPVMKALSIREKGDLARALPYIGVADRFLLDAKPPPGALLPGGNGVSFDWSLLESLDRRVDYMLSGGVDAGNVVHAIASTGASGVDVSSGVESSPGTKDTGKIAEFLAQVRLADRTMADRTGADRTRTDETHGMPRTASKAG